MKKQYLFIYELYKYGEKPEKCNMVIEALNKAEAYAKFKAIDFTERRRTVISGFSMSEETISATAVILNIICLED